MLVSVEVESGALALRTKRRRSATSDSGRSFEGLCNLVRNPAFPAVARSRCEGTNGHQPPASMEPRCGPRWEDHSRPADSCCIRRGRRPCRTWAARSTRGEFRQPWPGLTHRCLQQTRYGSDQVDVVGTRLQSVVGGGADSVSASLRSLGRASAGCRPRFASPSPCRPSRRPRGVVSG